jgi:hypothetical protein
MPGEENSPNKSTTVDSVGTGPNSPENTQIEPEKVLYTWRSQSRPFKVRTREFWISVIAIAAISGFIVYIVEGLIPVLLIIALVFLYYILNTVEPKQIEYSITNKGIKIENELTEMDLLTRFWFHKRMGSDLLILETLVFPGRFELVVNERNKEQIKKVLSKYIPNEEASPSRIDRTATWMSRKFPGNN